jgi:hypothetical protein
MAARQTRPAPSRNGATRCSLTHPRQRANAAPSRRNTTSKRIRMAAESAGRSARSMRRQSVEKRSPLVLPPRGVFAAWRHDSSGQIRNLAHGAPLHLNRTSGRTGRCTRPAQCHALHAWSFRKSSRSGGFFQELITGQPVGGVWASRRQGAGGSRYRPPS